MEQKIQIFKIIEHPILKEYEDVSLEDIPRLPLKQDIDFMSNSAPRTSPISKSSYRMSSPKLMEFKIQLQDLMDEKYIRPSVYPWGAPILFVNKKDGTLRLCIDY